MLKHRGEPVGIVQAPNAAWMQQASTGTSNVYIQNTTPATYTSANVSVAQ